jgi:hypothetical protein
VCVADPVVFIMNTLAKRPDVWGVWEVIAKVVVDLTVPVPGAKNEWCTISPEAGTMLKARVLRIHPEWAERYDAWDAKTGRAALVKRFMEMCRHKTRCHIIAEFAVPAGKRAAALIYLHRGKDCKDIAELLNAPTNTDTTESMIGLLDYNLYRSLCNFHTIFGVVNAQEMQIFTSQASQVGRVNKKKGQPITSPAPTCGT